MSPVVTFENVQKRFRARDGRETLAVENLSFTVAAGEYVCIVGRSGCGKSTSINLILGLLDVTAGRVRVLEVDPHRDFESLRGRISCVFQADRLLPWRTAIGNVRLPLEIIGKLEQDLPLDAAAWLRRLGLQGFEEAYPYELSGGMRQRVALARALVSDPDLILADESFASLDAITGEALRRNFHQLIKTTGKTAIHITHSIDEALALADRIIVVGKPGRVLDVVTTAEHVDKQALRARIVDLMGVFQVDETADAETANAA